MSLPVESPNVTCPKCGKEFKLDHVRLAGSLESGELKELVQAIVDREGMDCGDHG